MVYFKSWLVVKANFKYRSGAERESECSRMATGTHLEVLGLEKTSALSITLSAENFIPD